MKKKLLEYAEQILTGLLSASACMGLFLMAWFFWKLVYDQVSDGTGWALFLGSVIVTRCLTQLLRNVRYLRLEILADELEDQKDEEARALYEHLEVK